MKPGLVRRPVRRALVTGSLALSIAGGGTAWAQTPVPVESRPSVFTYAGRGFLVGGMVGLSGGYLAARGGEWESSDWQPLAYGTGIGALTGGALGLTLGILDTSRNTPGYGALILRDTVYGAGFGAVAGGIVGGLTAISSREPEHILLGASVGTLVGAVAGIVLGVIEGNRALERNGYSPARAEGFGLGVATAMARSPDGSLAWLPAATGAF
ncbi:MAG TPA: hypothetical protein VGF45_18280 [Polyangia bacterium]